MQFKILKSKWRGAARKVAAGSLAAGAVVAAMVPFNMGGCSGTDAGSIAGAVTSVASGNAPSLGGGGSGGGGGTTGNKYADIGLAGVQGFQSFTMGEPEERALGQSAALNLTDKYGVADNDRLNKYVTMVAQTLVNSSDAGGEVYVGVLNTDEVNAYAGPNGYVMVTRGALRQMRDESELAGVLAHEIAHVQRRHGLESVKTAGVTGAVAKGVAAGVDQRSQGWASFVGNFADTFFNSQYSQGQERDADADAVRLTARAGYDPNGLARFLDRIRTGQGGGVNFFPSHPGSTDRIRSVSSQISRENLRRGQTNADRFQRNVLTNLK